MGKRMEETMKLYDSGVYLVNGNELVPVSYTHLTLPTKLEV